MLPTLLQMHIYLFLNDINHWGDHQESWLQNCSEQGWKDVLANGADQHICDMPNTWEGVVKLLGHLWQSWWCAHVYFASLFFRFCPNALCPSNDLMHPWRLHRFPLWCQASSTHQQPSLPTSSNPMSRKGVCVLLPSSHWSLGSYSNTVWHILQVPEQPQSTSSPRISPHTLAHPFSALINHQKKSNPWGTHLLSPSPPQQQPPCKQDFKDVQRS